jgi:hypothetical protein
MGWIGNTNRRKRNRDFWWKNLKNEDPLEELGVKESIILKSIVRKYDRRMWTVFMCLRVGSIVVFFPKR